MPTSLALAAAALAVAALPAAGSAATSSRHHGECAAQALPLLLRVTVPEESDFLLYAVVTVVSDGAAPVPTGATVHCELRGETGTVHGSATGTGTGAVVVAGEAPRVDVTLVRTLCTVVDYADSTVTRESCAPFRFGFPPGDA